MESTSRSILVSLVVVALASTALVAAVPSASAAPGGTPQDTEMSAKSRVRFGYAVETELVSLQLTGTLNLPAIRLTGEQNQRISSFFDVFYDLSYGDRHDSGNFRVDSFFDLSMEMRKGDPASGQGDSFFVHVNGGLTQGAVRFSSLGLDIETDSFFDVFFDVSRSQSGGMGTMVSSFFDVFFDVMYPPDPGLPALPLLSYDHSRIQRTTVMSGQGESVGRLDSFFDVFFDLADVGNQQQLPATASSFFDVFFDVFRKSGKEELQLDADGKAMARYNSDPYSEDAIRLLVFTRGSQSASLTGGMFDFIVGSQTRGDWRGVAQPGTTEIVGDSFFDITYRIGNAPALHGSGLLELQLQFNLEVRQYQTLSNVLKTRHDTAMSVIQNLR